MTIETETAPPARSGLVTKGAGFLKALAALFLIAAVGAWISLGVGIYLDVARGTKLILAVVAVLATEVTFWTVAALLGVSVFRARSLIWRKITGRGDQGA